MIRQAQAEAGTATVAAFAHGYGPLEDVRSGWVPPLKRANGQLWVNRYGYLSDAKLEAIGELSLPGATA